MGLIYFFKSNDENDSFFMKKHEKTRKIAKKTHFWTLFFDLFFLNFNGVLRG